MRTLYESILDMDKNHDVNVIATLLKSGNRDSMMSAVKLLHNIVVSENMPRIKSKSKIDRNGCYIKFTPDYEKSGGIDVFKPWGADIKYYFTDLHRTEKFYDRRETDSVYYRGLGFRDCEIYELTGEFADLFNILEQIPQK